MGRTQPGVRARICVLVATTAVSVACSGASGSQDAGDSPGGSVGPAESTAATSEGNSEPAPGTELVFQTAGTIWTLDATGTRHDVGTQVEGSKEHADWSPDGTRLVFESNFLTLWVTNADGSDPQKLYECLEPCYATQDASWSPDGTEIVFMTTDSDGADTESSQLLAVNADTGDVRLIYEDRSRDTWLYQPRWSPDGQRIVFEADQFASTLLTESQTLRSDILVVDASGGGEARRVKGTRGALWDDWSPDGKWLVYTKDGNLFTVHPDGTSRKRLTSFKFKKESGLQPMFTPDGTGIVFTKVNGLLYSGAETTDVAILDLASGDISTVPGSDGATHPKLRP